MSAPLASQQLLKEMWIGKPGTMMRFPCINMGYINDQSRGMVTHSLANGGFAVTKRLHVKRQWQLIAAHRTEDQAALIRSIYMGVPTRGPYNLYDPGVRNQLTDDSSHAGAISSAVPKSWAVADGTLAYFGATASPFPPFYGPSVTQWSGYTSGSLLGMYGAGALLDAGAMAPTLPQRPATFTCYVRALNAGAYSMSANLYTGSTVGGSTIALLQAGSVTTVNNAGWTRLTVSWPAYNGSDKYYCPVLKTTTTGATFLIAAPQLEYYSTASPWVAGLGPARVSAAEILGGGQSYYWLRDYQLNLAEVG